MPGRYRCGFLTPPAPLAGVDLRVALEGRLWSSRSGRGHKGEESDQVKLRRSRGGREVGTLTLVGCLPRLGLCEAVLLVRAMVELVSKSGRVVG